MINGLIQSAHPASAFGKHFRQCGTDRRRIKFANKRVYPVAAHFNDLIAGVNPLSVSPAPSGMRQQSVRYRAGLKSMEISIVNPNQIAAEGQRLVQLGLVVDFYQHPDPSPWRNRAGLLGAAVPGRLRSIKWHRLPGLELPKFDRGRA